MPPPSVFAEMSPLFPQSLMSTDGVGFRLYVSGDTADIPVSGL
jgi:hypothetical protein